MGKNYMSTYATMLIIQMNIIKNQQEIRTEILFVSFSILRQSWTKVLRHFRFPEQI